jgi:hypothetical protein
MTLTLFSFLLLFLGTSGADRKIVRLSSVGKWRSRIRSPQKEYPNAQVAEEIAIVEDTPRTLFEDLTLNGAITTLLSFEFSMRESITSSSLSLDLSIPVIEPSTPSSSSSSYDGTVVSTNDFGGIIVSVRDMHRCMTVACSTLT